MLLFFILIISPSRRILLFAGSGSFGQANRLDKDAVLRSCRGEEREKVSLQRAETARALHLFSPRLASVRGDQWFSVVFTMRVYGRFSTAVVNA